METIVRTVGELDQNVRSAFEQVVGHALGDRQRLVIPVISNDPPPSPPAVPPPDLPEWTNVYQGLTDAEVDDLDAAIRERANLSRPSNGTS
jgi:hypothetical protein